MSKFIYVGHGKVTIVDDEDYEDLSKYKWHLGNGRYVRRRRPKYCDGKSTWITLSRYVMNAPDDKYVDHINGDILDNRKENLRLVTNSQNQMNRKKGTRRSSEYKGVTKLKWGKWQAAIHKDGKHYHIGTFSLEKDAAIAYNQKALSLFGEFAKLNEVL